MIRDAEQLQRELDAAQADLQRHVGELKHLVEQKLERPKHVIDETRHAIAVVKTPFAWLHVHAIVATLGALAIGAAAGLFGAHRRSALRGRRRLRLRLVGK